MRTTHHNESSGRSDWFVLHRISQNDERSRVVTSAIEPPRASSPDAQHARGNASFVTSRGASSPRTRRLRRSQKPLFFGPKSHFNLRREQPDTDALRAVLQSDLVQAVGSALANIGISRIRLPARPIPKWQRKSPWKEFRRLALPHPGRICDAHNKCNARIRGASFKNSVKSLDQESRSR